MRLRNSTTGTVISVGDDSAQRYRDAGWTDADQTSSSQSRRSTSERTEEDEDQKPRRRRTSR